MHHRLIDSTDSEIIRDFRFQIGEEAEFLVVVFGASSNLGMKRPT